MANPIPITTTDPDGDGTVSVTITDLTHPNAFSTDGVNFNGTASFGGITALQQTLNLDHSVTLTGDLSHLTITSTVASTDVLQVDAHNSEGGDIFGFIDWPVVSPDLGGPTAIGFSMNPQAGNSLASLGTFFQIGENLPGGLPSLAKVHVVQYDEQKWTAARPDTMQKIQDVVQKTR